MEWGGGGYRYSSTKAEFMRNIFAFKSLGGATEYIFYCKRAILFLSSSKILTPPPIPLSARRACPPPATKAGGTHSRGGEGDGGSIFWKTREIGLPSYSKICTLWAGLTMQCHHVVTVSDINPLHSYLRLDSLGRGGGGGVLISGITIQFNFLSSLFQLI